MAVGFGHAAERLAYPVDDWHRKYARPTLFLVGHAFEAIFKWRLLSTGHGLDQMPKFGHRIWQMFRADDATVFRLTILEYAEERHRLARLSGEFEDVAKIKYPKFEFALQFARLDAVYTNFVVKYPKADDDRGPRVWFLVDVLNGFLGACSAHPDRVLNGEWLDEMREKNRIDRERVG